MNNTCIHCHLCRENCRMLKKHGLDVTELTEHPELAYHCFLCGACSDVCPTGIDGRGLAESIREKLATDPENLKPYRFIKLEKERYIFRNARGGKKRSVFFPGCNFTGYYPRTTQRAYELLKEHGDCGILYDCCGKPVAELGDKQAEQEMLARMEKHLAADGVEELITACPNCHAYLKSRLSIPVISIYEKLRELGIGTENPKPISGKVFLPCPDRREKAWLEDMQPFFRDDLKAHLIEGVQCCGLGGCVGKKEADLIADMGEKIREQMQGENLYTYCASCSGKLSCKTQEAAHLLTLILETQESPDIKKGWLNRAFLKFR